MKTRAQNTLVGNSSSTRHPATIDRLASAGGSSSGASALEKAAKVATASSRASKWRGVEMIIVRSSIQNMIQMLIFEGIKTRIIDMEFSNGSRDLPKMKREIGRDRKLM